MVNEQDLVAAEERVLALIKSLKFGNAPGLDGLNKQKLCIVSESVAPILMCIYNYSLKTGILPQEWKLDNVTPIFKQGDCTSLANYRLIFLLFAVKC